MNATISQTTDGIEIASPYNADFVDALKIIPREARSWKSERKAWAIAAAYAEAAVSIASRFFDLIDARVMSSDEVEEAKIASEIAKIEGDQQFIISRKGEIEAEIQDLSGDIAGYSRNSKSAIKYQLARTRALLQNALAAAAKPVDALLEIDVRGLAAARRHLEGGK